MHSDGEELREEDSPSWYNPRELGEVLKVLESIKGEFPELPNRDIGIITPYRKQVQKLRGSIHMRRPLLDGIKVGVTEEFQGRENKVSLKFSIFKTRSFKLSFIRL